MVKLKNTPHNLLITLIGGILVWIGWYGFNTGSAYTLNDVALTSFVNTIIAASGGAFSWLVVEYCITKKLSLLGLLSGVLAGLVDITPAEATLVISVLLLFHLQVESFVILLLM